VVGKGGRKGEGRDCVVFCVRVIMVDYDEGTTTGLVKLLRVCIAGRGSWTGFVIDVLKNVLEGERSEGITLGEIELVHEFDPVQTETVEEG